MILVEDDMNQILSIFVGAERKIHMKVIIHLYLVVDICCFRQLMDVNMIFCLSVHPSAQPEKVFATV